MTGKRLVAGVEKCYRCGMSFRVLERKDQRLEWTICPLCHRHFGSGTTNTGKLIQTYVLADGVEQRQGRMT